MSYATSLLTTYPSSYGTSTLLSDNLVGRSSFESIYRPTVSYGNTSRFLSDDLAFNQLTHDISEYQPSLYTIQNSSSIYPTTDYRSPPRTTFQKSIPPHDSYASLNDIPEYSESLVTASNTNTASSVARSIDNHNAHGPKHMINHAQHNYNRQSNDNRAHQPNKGTWNPATIKKNSQADELKKNVAVKNPVQATTNRNQPLPISQKGFLEDKLNEDLTPVQSPQVHHLQRNPTIADMERQAPSIDIQAWVNETKKGSPVNDKVAEQTWSVKIGQLHMAQAQHEKDKFKGARALPNPPKRVENKSFTTKAKPASDAKSHNSGYQPESYFDSLFEGDYFRKPSTNNYSVSSSFRQAKPKPKPTILQNNTNSKQTTQNKTNRYEPPTTKRPAPVITTTSWRKQPAVPYHYDPLYANYLYNESDPHTQHQHAYHYHPDLVHKDTEERFREALQKLRADRAEQQVKDLGEKVAKRSTYGDYVRHSTKDGSLQTGMKPLPWSDFMDLKKGNVYSLSKEEKKELYHQSKTYGERVRYRNFAINYANESNRPRRYSAPLSDDSQNYESGHETPQHKLNLSDSKSVSRTSKRPGSGSIANRNHLKQQAATRGSNRGRPNQVSRTTIHTDRSNRQSENGDEDQSTHDVNQRYQQKPKKRNVNYGAVDSSERTAQHEDENENGINAYGQRGLNSQHRDVDTDLYTVREDKTAESWEGARYKNR